MILCFVFFFFFKQKTAYEMRISDWSSDVCSSDLHDAWANRHARDEAGAGTDHRRAAYRAARADVSALADAYFGLDHHTGSDVTALADLRAVGDERAGVHAGRKGAIRIKQCRDPRVRSEEHTSEPQSLMRTQYA